MTTESEKCVDILLEKSNQIDAILEQLNDSSDTKKYDENSSQAQTLLQDTQTFLNNNRSLVPSYILMKINNSLQNLEKRLQTPKRANLIFKFKSSSSDNVERKNVTPKSSLAERKKTVEKNDTIANFFGIRDTSYETYSLTPDEVEEKDVSLIDLDHCTVNIHGLASTVYIRKLRNCTVTVYMASRAITVTECSDCCLNLICQQLRIDSTKHCTFNVFISAKSMLEASRGLKFKALELNELPIEVPDFMDRAKFDKSVNNWRSIDDFDWLSPDKASENFELLQRV